MTNDEINEHIAHTCDAFDNLYDAFGWARKCIPYIGWFWRDVDFDEARTHGIRFGVLPPDDDDGGRMTRADKPMLGFMVKNKWDYKTVHVTATQWAGLEPLLMVAVLAPSVERLAAFNDALQAFAPTNPPCSAGGA